MGFVAMVVSGLLGLVLLILGAMRAKDDRRWLASALLGVVLVAVAAWLAWPK